MSKIFISYASEDRPRAKIIAEALEHQGYSVWWDVDIPPGKTFDNTIKVELDAAKCIIVLWSRKSVLSDWVKEESSEGVKRKILIPVLIDDVEIPLGFKRIQAARLIDWSGTLPNPEFDILLKSVKELVDQKQSLKVQEIKKEDNQTKIFGTIRDPKNQDPVKGANIRFIIEGTEITSVISNEHGEYEYIAEQDYIGQILDFAIQKDGFERTNISYEIDKDEIEADILLNKIEIEKKEIVEVIEKTRILGTILDSVSRNPAQEASIKLSIEGRQIASITSNKQGEYEFIAEQDYTGQTLDISIKKDNYIKKNISFEIDRPTIKSDILLDGNKIKIKGKICDEADNPLDNGSISFSIGNSTIDLTSDKNGSFSFTVGQQFLNQGIGYEVNKEGFKIKNGKLKLLENLKCINISKSIPPTESDKSKWIKNAVVGIGLIGLTGLVIYLFALPTGLEVSPDSIDFDTDNVYKEINISKKGLGTIDWDIDKSKDWITVTPTSGSNSRTIIVSIDKTGLDPVNHNGNIALSSKGGLLSKFYSETKIINVSLNIKPTSKPKIHSFIAEPNHTDGKEGEITLSWEVTNATSVTIDGVIPLEVLKGSIDKQVEQNTTFTLKATNEAGISDVRTVTVTVKKQMPELSVNPDPLDLNYGTMYEGDTDSRTFSILNTGSGTLEWSIGDNQTWITVNPTSGINSGEVIVTANTVKLKPGDYSGIITIESNGGNKNGTINLIREGITTPTQLSPANGSIFDHYPRTTTLEWEAVLGAMSYTVEIDCYHCCEIDQWYTDIGETWKIQSDIQTTSYAFNYVNTEPGRWRVWAVNANGQESVKSSWWYFEYIV
ncbi:MAG: TIR domain-containing protein [Methanosarcinales archaeon]